MIYDNSERSNIEVFFVFLIEWAYLYRWVGIRWDSPAHDLFFLISLFTLQLFYQLFSTVWSIGALLSTWKGHLRYCWCVGYIHHWKWLSREQSTMSIWQYPHNQSTYLFVSQMAFSSFPSPTITQWPQRSFAGGGAVSIPPLPQRSMRIFSYLCARTSLNSFVMVTRKWVAIFFFFFFFFSRVGMFKINNLILSIIWIFNPLI